MLWMMIQRLNHPPEVTGVAPVDGIGVVAEVVVAGLLGWWMTPPFTR